MLFIARTSVVGPAAIVASVLLLFCGIPSKLNRNDKAFGCVGMNAGTGVAAGVGVAVGLVVSVGAGSAQPGQIAFKLGPNGPWPEDDIAEVLPTSSIVLTAK